MTLADRHKLPESKISKFLQTDTFQSEQAEIEKNQTVLPNSKLRKTAPFIDSDGLIRAKGRLKHLDLHFDQNLPIILPANHVAVKIFNEREHKSNNHEGNEYVEMCDSTEIVILLA